MDLWPCLVDSIGGLLSLALPTLATVPLHVSVRAGLRKDERHQDRWGVKSSEKNQYHDRPS